MQSTPEISDGASSDSPLDPTPSPPDRSAFDAEAVPVEAWPELESPIRAPAGVIVQTMGVDVQREPPRLEAQRVGWGFGEEAWVLGYYVLHGDPAGSAVWTRLRELLDREWGLWWGGTDYIRACAVDSGYQAQEVYRFCEPRTWGEPAPDGRRRYVWATKGQEGSGEVWPRAVTLSKKGRAPLWNIKVWTAKDVLHARLKPEFERPGAGCIHFGDTLPDAYFDQLTAQHAVTETNDRGFPRRIWKMKNEHLRDEALDTWVYAYAALCGLYAFGFEFEPEAAHQAQRQAAGAPGRPVPNPQGTAGQAPAPASAPPPGQGGRPVRRSSYLGG